ncbi:Indoleamine 2-3-dioxygenase [Penicillium malachiteum]|uniref:Indoleamine 2-3-dioxygenase n=1 Tax=Penicillium malachiteum TaxID=1324776 RepID=UPI0025495D50|nr:Indoleamine 2-3-dioxygenase [Penicillium malachiteum]KAJ5726692.1 Indoleamine 2-3-dioxygenase [Penicillium malachiteum]
MLNSPNINLDEYEVSSENGFLPSTLPLFILPSNYYKPWERLAHHLPALLQSGQIRSKVDDLPLLTTDCLQTEPEWRRAYSILGFITHAYIWGGSSPEDNLPTCLSKPFIEISEHLGLPPCATYAGLALWNYTAAPGADITDPDNLCTLTSFTGTTDEEWFIVISVAIEAKGGKLLTLMLDAVAAATAKEPELLAALLCQFTERLQDFNNTLKRMNERCTPEVFFHQIRPLLAGSKGMASAGLAYGVFYNDGNNSGEWRQYSGGSNAQSSLIQTFDIFLGVNHSATGGISGPTGYLMDMRTYMPAPHRNFLGAFDDVSNIRSYVISESSHAGPTLKEAFNAACMMLSEFRDTHLQIVTRYIHVPARRGIPKDEGGSERVNLASASAQVEGLDEETPSGLYGTGGTSLIPFLRQTRDATKDATC